jgi:hypothetical protein
MVIEIIENETPFEKINLENKFIRDDKIMNSIDIIQLENMNVQPCIKLI